MPSTLLLRIEGPLQSWGGEGAALRRTTRSEPTFSGVIGLIANALGRRRDEDVSDLGELRFGVRCDHPGHIMRDYQTAGAGPFPRTAPEFPGGIRQADGKIPTDRTKRILPTSREMISDAAFLCGLEGDPDLLRTVDDALAAPARPLFLGRKANPPSRPLRLNDGLHVDVELIEALKGYPLLDGRRSRVNDAVRMLITSKPGEPWDQLVRDVPVGNAFVSRRFQTRRLRTFYLEQSSMPPYLLIDPDDPLDVWVPGDVVA